MRVTRSIPVLVAAALAACDQTSQSLPFELSQSSVTRTIGAEGGTIALPGAAAVQLPAGALAAPASVTLAVADGSSAVLGGAAASAWFGTQSLGSLGRPAEVEVKFDAADRSRAWLVSLVNLVGAQAQEIGATRVDLSTGIATAELAAVGNFVAVVPPVTAVFEVAPLGAAVPAGAPSPIARRVGMDSVAIGCGGAAQRCGGISIQASANLLDKVQSAAVVYPAISGGLKLDPRTSSVRGRIGVDATVRVLLRGGISTANVALDVDDFQIDQRVALPFPLGSVASSLAPAAANNVLVIRVTDTVQIVNAAGETENATVAISFPVQLF